MSEQMYHRLKEVVHEQTRKTENKKRVRGWTREERKNVSIIILSDMNVFKIS